MTSTPTRGRQLLPTLTEQRGYLRKLREAADAGDLFSMAALVAFARFRPADPAHDLLKLGLADDTAKAEALAQVLDVAPQLRALLK